MSPVEYAWTSFNENAAFFDFPSNGGGGRERRFHPTQKPVALYEWIFTTFAKRGDKILDTHAGSASSLIACHNLGLPFVGFEIDPEYFAKADERLKNAEAQIRIDGTRELSTDFSTT